MDLVQNKEIVEELISIIEKSEDSEYADDYYPFYATRTKYQNPEKFKKYDFITMKDILHNENLVKEFCDWKYNDDTHEWYYECHPDCDKNGFFNAIPSFMTTYTNLNELTIVHSEIIKIENLPPNITYLDLSCNKIEKIENIPPKVKSLYLYFNKIQKLENIPESVTLLHICGHLGIYITKIENLPSKLEQLNISWEHINEIEDLSYLHPLEVLNADFTNKKNQLGLSVSRRV